MTQALRGKSLKVYEEVGQRHRSMALIHLGRYEEAEKVLAFSEQRGTNKMSERVHISWLVRLAMLCLLQGDFDGVMRHINDILTKLPQMMPFVFFAAYISAMNWIVRAADLYLISNLQHDSQSNVQAAEMWEYYCAKLGQSLDPLSSVPIRVQEGPLGVAFNTLNTFIGLALDRIWQIGATWPRLYPDSYLAHGRYFAAANRVDKALQCWRKGLQIAEKGAHSYAQAKVLRSVLLAIAELCL